MLVLADRVVAIDLPTADALKVPGLASVVFAAARRGSHARWASLGMVPMTDVARARSLDRQLCHRLRNRSGHTSARWTGADSISARVWARRGARLVDPGPPAIVAHAARSFRRRRPGACWKPLSIDAARSIGDAVYAGRVDGRFARRGCRARNGLASGCRRLRAYGWVRWPAPRSCSSSSWVYRRVIAACRFSDCCWPALRATASARRSSC